MTVKSNKVKSMDEAQPKWLPRSPGYDHSGPSQGVKIRGLVVLWWA